MTAHYTAAVLRSFAEAPLPVQKAFDKQVRFLLHSLRHPSLHTKKYNEAQGIWQARATRSWRFYFTIEGDVYHLLDLMAHPK